MMIVGDLQKNYCSFFKYYFCFIDWKLINLKKFRNLEKNVTLNVYINMPHGFLNYDSPAQGMPEAKICVQDSISLLYDLLNL